MLDLFFPFIFNVDEPDRENPESDWPDDLTEEEKQEIIKGYAKLWNDNDTKRGNSIRSVG